MANCVELRAAGYSLDKIGQHLNYEMKARTRLGCHWTTSRVAVLVKRGLRFLAENVIKRHGLLASVDEEEDHENIVVLEQEIDDRNADQFPSRGPLRVVRRKVNSLPGPLRRGGGAPGQVARTCVSLVNGTSGGAFERWYFNSGGRGSSKLWLIGAKLLRSGFEIRGEPSDALNVKLDGFRGEIAQGHVVDHAAAQRGHPTARRCHNKLVCT
jgi:hypothetical protein